jgi:L-ascorbate metabolism protein UlaG (beta-lactamase superfamily)
MFMNLKWLTSLVAFVFAVVGSSVARAQNVKITPLGAQAGEFCAPDRALLFEDPTGVRVLIAPGRTVNGSADERLGATGSIHVVLIDHPHVDHIGDVLQNCSGQPAGSFEFPAEGNAPEIAARHNSAVLVGGELPDFFTQKIRNVTGTVPAGCPAAGLDNTFTVPRTSPCVGVIRGGTRTAIFDGAAKGVKITTIPAFHAAGASRMHVDELRESNDPASAIVADPGVPFGLTGYAGSETGYIIRFSNGLSVLWTGDSGLIGDWATQADFYDINLAVVHGGDLFTMGPDEAAFAVKRLIKPRSVIPEHFNQVSTSAGKVNEGTRLERFIQQLSSRGGQDDRHGNRGGIKVVVPLSGVDISCNGKGDCQ